MVGCVMTINASLDKRLDKIVRNRTRMRRYGVVYRMDRDGLIRPRVRFMRPRFPIKGTLIIVTLFFVFKALLFAEMGADDYALRIDALRSGSMVEQIGAVIMQEEPVTAAIGGYLTQYLLQR